MLRTSNYSNGGIVYRDVACRISSLTYPLNVPHIPISSWSFMPFLWAGRQYVTTPPFLSIISYFISRWRLYPSYKSKTLSTFRCLVFDLLHECFRPFGVVIGVCSRNNFSSHKKRHSWKAVKYSFGHISVFLFYSSVSNWGALNHKEMVGYVAVLKHSSHDGQSFLVLEKGHLDTVWLWPGTNAQFSHLICTMLSLFGKIPVSYIFARRLASILVSSINFSSAVRLIS